MVWETHSPGQELTQSAIIITSSDTGEYLVELIGMVLGSRCSRIRYHVCFRRPPLASRLRKKPGVAFQCRENELK